MAYEEAIQAAGATIQAFQSFGSYQGDWWARVTLPDGRSGWINGSYGSCSGCDAYEAEFGCSEETCSEHAYESGPEVDACEACQKQKAAYLEKLARFGAGYLDDLLTQEQAEAKAAENLEWDSDAQEMVDFIRSESATSTNAIDPSAQLSGTPTPRADLSSSDPCGLPPSPDPQD